MCQSFEQQQCLVHRYDSRSFNLDLLASDVDLVCIAGGDGTIRTTIGNDQNSDHGIPYCVFPMGTINLVAREAGYRANFKNFVPDLTARSSDRKHFAGRVGDETFLCCASVGPDSHAVALVSPWLKKRIGRLAYVAAALKLCWAWPTSRLSVDIDGATYAAEAVYILKGRYYAGPWALDDEARLTRERFRVLLLPRARRRDFARLALFALFGPVFADPRWTRLDAQVVEVTGPASTPIQADGDIVAMTPARITVDPRPLTFLCGFGSRKSSRGRQEV